MTLNEIELDVYRRLDYADSPPTAVKNRIDGFINTRHTELLSTDRMRLFRSAITTLTTTAGQASYGLPFACARIQRITDTTNGYPLHAHSMEWYREVNPTGISGTPEAWIPMGMSPVARRPQGTTVLTGATAIYLQTTNAADNTVKFDVTGVLVDGTTVRVIDQVTGGITAVALPTLIGATDILEFAAKAPLTGSASLSDAVPPAGKISTIAAGTTTARYYRVALYPAPAASQQYLVDYEREIPKLTDPSDEPLLPYDFHDLIALLARLDEYEFKSDDRWIATKTQVDQRTRELRAWVDNHDPYRATAIPHRPARSRLGPWFPAGT